MATNFWEKDAVVSEQDQWWKKDSVVGGKLTQGPSTPEPPKEQSAFRQVADVPLSVGKGALSGIRMIADAFGAGSKASESIKGAEGYLSSLMSAQAKNDEQEIARIMKDAEDKGVLDQVKAGLKAFTVAPVDLISQGLGTAAPALLGLLGGKVLGAGALGARAIGAGIGAGMGAGTAKGNIYEATKEELVKAGLPEDQAEKRAQEAQAYGGKNLDQILLSTGLGAFASSTGLESATRRILMRGAAKQAAKETVERGLPAAAKAIGKGTLAEAAPEFVQAGQEQVAQNIALQREGFDVPTFRGAVGAGTLEALAGAGLGAGFSAAEVSRGGLREKAKEDAARILEQERAVQEPAPPITPAVREEPEMSLEDIERAAGIASVREEPQTVEELIAEEPVAKAPEAPAPAPAAPAVPAAPVVAAETAEPAAPAAEETPQQRFDRLSKMRLKVANAFRDGIITNQEFEKFQADLDAAREAAKSAPVDLSQLSPAKREILDLADKIEAAGQKGFADGMRGVARPEAREPDQKNMEFYREKLASLLKTEAVKAGEEKVEQVAYGLPEFFADTPKDAERIAGLRKSGPNKVRIALDEINDAIQTLADTIAAAGYRIDKVSPGQVPPAILRIKSQIGTLAAGANRLSSSAEAVQKGYKRADPKRVKADIEAALADITKAEELIAAQPNVPTAAEQMEGVAVPPSPEVQDLREQQRKAEEDMARIKKRGMSLWTALAGRLSGEEVRGLGGRNMKVGKNQFLNLAAKRGKPSTDLSDLVADGVLDAFLPPNMRHDAAQFDNQESTEYIREKLVSGNYTTHETQMAVETIGQEVLDIERRIQEELSLEDINREIQVASDEQREADQAVADFAAEGEAGAAAERKAEEATELDDLEKRAADAGIDVDSIREQAYYDTRGEEDGMYERTLADRLRGALDAQEQFLAVQTEKDLKAKEELQKAKEKAEQERKRADEEKAKADEAAADFVLTGSDRPADEAEARGQQPMFAAEKGQVGYSPDPEEQRVEKELTGKTMIQAADWAIQNAPNAFLKTIAEKVRNRLRELERRGVKLEFEVVGGDRRPRSLYDARGYMQPDWGNDTKDTTLRLVLNGAAVMNNQAGYPPGTRYSTVLHELLHVATRGYLQFAPLSDPLRRQMRDLTNAIIERYNSDAKAGKLPPVMQKYYKRMNNVLESDDEVLAWGLTDEDVQKYFADIKVGEKSVMTRLVELVRSVLGLGKQYESALDRLVKVSESMLDMDVSAIDAVLGNAGKRLGRAAPTTGEQQALFQKEIQKMTAGWTDGRIQSLIKEHGYSGGRTKAYAAFVDPDEFVNGTTPSAKRKSEIDREAGELDLEKIRSETQTPFLFINQINKGSPNEEWEIVGHEGRHRMSALSAAGVRRAPVILVMQENGFKSPGVYDTFSDVQVAGQSFDTGNGLDIDVFDGVPINKDNEQKLKQQFGEGEILYQQEGRQNVLGEVVLGSWTEPNETKMAGELGKDDIIYWLQDKMVDTKRVVEAITQTAGKIAERWNPYLQEELYHGRTAKETNDFLTKELRPLMQEMQKSGVTIGEFEQYLHNRHAEEYNKQVAKVNPNDPDMQDGGSGITTEDAKQYLADLPADKRKLYESLADRLDDITKGTRELLVKSGLESRETIEAWEKTFPDYVPLYREDVDFQYTTSSTGTGQGFDVRGPFSRRAMGSKRKVVDILANVAMQRERAIVKANKNKVAEAVYGLAVQNANPDFWMAVNPMAEKMPEAALEELKAMGIDEDAIQFLMKEPRQRAVDPKKNEVISRINTMLRNNDSVLSMRFNGENRYVFFNPNNERAARAAKALKNLDADQLGRVVGTIAKITRWMASVNTQYNPIFGAYNFLRDVQGAALQLTNTPLAGKQKQVTANVVPALRAIYTSLRKTRKGEEVDTEMAKLWDDFQKAGGQTGFRDMFSRSQERSEALQKEFMQMSEGKLKKAGRATLEWLSDYNDTMENAVRLSAYKVALDSGMSKQEAASVAKNLTVNFNRKGQVGVQAGALYAFFNAAVQGTTRLVQTLKGPAGRKIMAGGLLLGTIQAVMLAAAGFDEEEPPEFVRERNIIIPIGGDKYIALPMPLGYHVIPGTSRILTEWVLSGFKKTPERIASLTGMYLEAFNPIGNAGWSVQTIAPTFADPLVALMENKDWTGKPIARKDFSNLDPTPGYTRAKDAATFYSTKIAEFLNYISGGTKYQPGILSPTPDQIDYLIGQATGGIGREVAKLATTVEKTATGEELPPYKIPVVGRFYGETKSSAAEASRFYKNLEQLNKLENEIKGRRENKEPLGSFMADNPEARLIKRAESVYSDVKKLRERKEKLVERGASRESVKVVENQITMKMRMLNEQVENAKK